VGSRTRRELQSFLELFALAGFAVAQPLFDHLGRNATELVTGGWSGAQIVLVTCGVLLVPPAIAWAVEWTVGRLTPAARPWVHAAWAALAGLLAFVATVKPRTALGPLALTAGGITAGLVLGVVVLRVDAVRLWLRYLAIAPVLFAGMFLFTSPATAVVRGHDPATAAVTPRHPHRVVMVVLDEFPLESLLDGTGHVDADLYPNFAALAATSHWYRNSTTVSPFTETAVPALLTGREPPSADAVPGFTTYPENLFTLLGRTYSMNVHETLTRLCPDGLCGDAGGGSVPDLARTTATDWWHLVSPTRLPAVKVQTATWPAPQFAGKPFVRSLIRTTGPRLDFLHVALPHQEWRFLGTGQDNHGEFAPGIDMPPNTFTKPRWTNAWSAESGRQAHLLQVQATDRLIGSIVDRLRRIGAWDDSMVVVTADHGVAFDPEEPVRGVSATNYPEILWTPLFVKYPGERAGRIDDRPAHSVDVLPTIADVNGVADPWTVDGRTLRGAPRTSTRVRTLDWNWSTIHPAHGRFLTVDGDTGFARVLRAGAAPAAGDARLRLYRIGPYSDLVGQAVAPLAGGTPVGTATIDASLRASIVPDAHNAPWTRPGGVVTGLAPDTWLAISVNGTVAGLSRVYRNAYGTLSYWAELPPSMFRPGRNAVALWSVTGSPGAPHLRPIAASR
jgi:hypothetical protein